VVAGDGEVPHPAGPVFGCVAAECGGGGAGGGVQVGAVFEGGGLTHRWAVASQKRWLLVVMTVVWFRPGPSGCSGWCRGGPGTAETVSAVVLPVLVLVTRTLSPVFSLLMATRAPDAVRTLVLAVKNSPTTTAAVQDSAILVSDSHDPTATARSRNLIGLLVSRWVSK
jgi:hypothetical protein